MSFYRKLSLAVVVVVGAQTFDAESWAQQGPQQCVALNELAETHAKQAQAIQTATAEGLKSQSVEAAKRAIAESEKASKAEWELAALARDAYRKCLRDYLSAGAAPRQTGNASAAPKASPAPVTRNESPKPVQKVTQKKPQRKTTVAKPSQPKRQSVQQAQPEPQQVEQSPSIGIFPLGLGIIGGVLGGGR